MFRAATAFDQTLNEWDVSSVTNMSALFESAAAFNQNLCAWGAKMNDSSTH
jgi:surface protein